MFIKAQVKLNVALGQLIKVRGHQRCLISHRKTTRRM